MALEEHSPHGRSSRRVPRLFQDLHASDQRSFFAGRKTQTKSVSDKLLWFSPVHSPLLSPAREKPAAKKKVRQSSIFSIQSRGKGSIVAEEPTSPKVSCIGQVRGHKKDKDPFADALRKKCSQSRPGSISPARFFASPGRSSKWGSLFSSRKDSCATTPGSSGNGVGDLSCFGLPSDSRAAFQTDKTCSFLARCPDLFQDHRRSDNCHKDQLIVQVSNAPVSQFEERAAFVPANRCIDAISAEKSDSQLLMPDFGSRFPQKQEGEGRVGTQSKHSEVGHLTGAENFSQADFHNGTNAVKQRLNYEDLPSLNCGAYMKQNMKISVEIVPETWLWRDGEKLGVGSTSHTGFVQERSRSTSRDDLQNAQHEERIMPLSPCKNSHSNTKEGEQCVDYEIMQGHSSVEGFEDAEKNHVTNDCLVEARLNFVNDSLCKPVDAGKKTMNDPERTCAKPSRSQVVESSSFLQVVAAQKRREESHGGAYAAWNSSFFRGETNRFQIRKPQVHIDKSRTETEVDKSGGGKVSSELKPPSLQTMRRIGVDLGKENYSIALPGSLERNLPSLQSKEDEQRFWSMFKGGNAEACSEQPFGTLILVGYDQLAASKNLVCNDKELFKGVLEVGRLSFHGSGKYFQVLSSDAAFNRSRSATSVRTVIRLQRCNSDPCRPSY